MGYSHSPLSWSAFQPGITTLSGRISCLQQCQGGDTELGGGSEGLGGNKGACKGETQQLLLMGAQVVITMLLAGIY